MKVPKRPLDNVLPFNALCCGLICSAVQASGLGQQPPAPAADEPSLEALVVEVQGSVKHAAVGVSATDKDGWIPVKLDDRLPTGTQIKTGIRSYVTLMFGDNTVVHVRRMSLASIDEFYRTQTEETIRLGLGYGAIRAGSTEAELRSDLVIDSTVATLAKRGTEGIQFEVDPSIAWFRTSVGRGLVEMLYQLEQRNVRAFEYADAVNIMKMWIKQDVFDRKVTFYADESVGEVDADVFAANTGGVSVLAPGSGTEAAESSGKIDPDVLAGRVTETQEDVTRRFAPTLVSRPEGDFGIAPTISRALKRRPASSAIRAHKSRPWRSNVRLIRKR